MQVGDHAVVRANPRSLTVEGGEDIVIVEIRHNEVTAQVMGLPPGRGGQRRILREDVVVPGQLTLF